MAFGMRQTQMQVVEHGEDVDVEAQAAVAHDVLLRCLRAFPHVVRPESYQGEGAKGDRTFYLDEVRLMVYGKTRTGRTKYAFGFTIAEQEVVHPPYQKRNVGKATVMVLEDLSVKLDHRSGTLANPPRGPHAKALVECALKGR